MPLELGFFGLSAPHCLVLADQGLRVASLVDPRGCTTLPVAMLFAPALRGSAHFSRWFLLDGANPAGLVACNALEFPIE